jgi:hypothetical protein
MPLCIEYKHVDIIIIAIAIIAVQPFAGSLPLF